MASRFLFIKSITPMARLIFGIVLLLLVNATVGDIEPKINYEDPTIAVTKINKVGVETASIGNTLATDSTKVSLPITDLGFIHAFVASISVILVSELGDKTFFIAAIMAMRHPRLTVFFGAMSALGLMTILSAVFGMAATIIPRVYTYYISTALFAIFGLKMLKDGYYMSATDAQEELEEVQSDLRKREDELMKSMKKDNDLSSSTSRRRCSDDDDDDDDDDDRHDDQTRSMLSSTVSSGTTGTAMIIGGSSDTSRRSKNHHNQLSSASMGNLTDVGSITPSANSRYAASSVGGGLDSSSSAGGAAAAAGSGPLAIASGDINANGMELIQIGSKKRLEREVSSTLVQDPESGVVRKQNPRRSAAYLASRIFMQAFTMTFLAEWGDRSQLTTIILSAREDVYGVIVGGCLGHAMCTGLAVIGGRMIAQRISVRTVTLVGGVVFILFAISALFFNPNEE